MIYPALAVALGVASILIAINSKRIEKVVDTHKSFRGKQNLRRVYNLNQYVTSAVKQAVNTLLGKKIRGTYGGAVEYMLIYPIKSVSAGLRVTEWELRQYGFKGDRQYMLSVYDEKEECYTMVTLKKCQKLATVQVSFSEETQMFTMSYLAEGKEQSFQLPIEVTESFVAEHSSQPSTVQRIHMYSQIMQGYVLDKILPESFIKAMGLPEKTILLSSPDGRPCTVMVPKKERTRTVFQDYYPLLVCSEESLAEVRKYYKGDQEMVGIRNFRPNLVIENTPGPFDEDNYAYWDLVSADGHRHRFHSPVKCIRCNLPNLDYNKGAFDPKYNMSKALAKFRRVDELYPASTCFGIYTLNLDSHFVVRNGDKLDVLLRQVSCWVQDPFTEKMNIK